MKYLRLFFLVALLASVIFPSQKALQKDTIKTAAGNLEITFIGHGSLIFSINGTVIHIDPWTKLADYSTLPKADLVLITHEHFDHLDTLALQKINKAGTITMLPRSVYNIIGYGEILKNGEKKSYKNITIEAVPAYNTTPGNEKFHPKGRDNGYILTIGGKRIYIAGDTENTPEMYKLKHIDIAFLPMNQPYTMTPAQVAKTVKQFKPKILYPYHYGETNVQELQNLLASDKHTEIRIRQMQ